MKISIKNFKAIRELNDYEIKPMNILSGANSSGKTSFIQFLLMIKQTLEYGGLDDSLLLFNNSNIVDLGYFSQIVHKNHSKDGLYFKIEIKSNLLRKSYNFNKLNSALSGIKKSKNNINKLSISFLIKKYTNDNLFISNINLIWLWFKKYGAVGRL